MSNKNGTWKWIAGTLAICLVSVITWWATQVWGKQEKTNQTNTQQDVNILTLQANIVATDKAVQRIERSLIEDRACRKKQDSILQDVAIKVSLMYDGR